MLLAVRSLNGGAIAVAQERHDEVYSAVQWRELIRRDQGKHEFLWHEVDSTGRKHWVSDDLSGTSNGN
jgi:hypothetical protein